jgi:ribonuclease HI
MISTKKTKYKQVELLFSDNDSDSDAEIVKLDNIFNNKKTLNKNDNLTFETAFNGQEPDYYVYTDGACSNNGSVDAQAGFGIFFSENDPRNASQKVIGKQSNNTAELYAVFHLYDIIKEDILNGLKIGIVTDSQYVIRCLTSYGQKLDKQNWISKKIIPNKDLVKQTYELYKDKENIKFIHIFAHTDNTDIHSIGNDHADKLANKAIGLDECPYSKKNIINHVDKLSNKSIGLNECLYSKLYLDVPFSKKDIIKGLGGRWNNTIKKWYILSNSLNKDEVLNQFNVDVNII